MGLKSGKSPEKNRDNSNFKHKHRLRNLYFKKANVSIVKFEKLFKEISNAPGEDLRKLFLIYFLRRILLFNHRDSSTCPKNKVH